MVFGTAAGGSATSLPGDLRKRLWAEHLGFRTAGGAPDPTEPQLQTTTGPPNGWIKLWDERAHDKLQGLRAKPVTLHPARILPWTQVDGETPNGISDPKTYLQAFGIAPTGSPPTFEIVETFDFYDFEEDEWV